MKLLHHAFKTYLLTITFLGFLGVGCASSAQDNGFRWENKDNEVQLGASRGNSHTTIFEHIVESKGADTLKINFKGVGLGANSYLQLTSLDDGATQTLDAHSLKEADYASAFFNGDQVLVTLHTAKNEEFSHLWIDSIDVGYIDDRVVGFSQCGSVDNRVPSFDDAVARIMPIGCTGWLIDNRKVITAGHCISSSTQSLHFNVPRSTPGGRRVNPGPEDQYTIIRDSIKYRNGGPGDDWAVFEVRKNSQTGLHPVDAQGKTFKLVRNQYLNTIRITGYGGDSGSRNFIQQTHSGPFSGFSGTRMSYKVDTEGGNSGGPVIDETTGYAVGIHTHGGCSTNGGGSNSGTSTYNNAFWLAADANSGPCLPASSPTGLKATNVTTDSFEASWSAVANAESYKIQLWQEGNRRWIDYKTFDSTSALVNLTANEIEGSEQKFAYYRVIAISKCGESSNPSAWITVELAIDVCDPSATLPAPTNLTFSRPRTRSFQASWSAVRGANSYTVQLWQDGPKRWINHKTVESTSVRVTLTDKEIEGINNTEAYYRVYAESKCGAQSPPAQWVKVDLAL